MTCFGRKSSCLSMWGSLGGTLRTNFRQNDAPGGLQWAHQKYSFRDPAGGLFGRLHRMGKPDAVIYGISCFPYGKAPIWPVAQNGGWGLGGGWGGAGLTELSSQRAPICRVRRPRPSGLWGLFSSPRDQVTVPFQEPSRQREDVRAGPPFPARRRRHPNDPGHPHLTRRREWAFPTV